MTKKKGKRMTTQSQTHADTPYVAQVQRHGKRKSRRGVGCRKSKKQAVSELTEVLEHEHVMETFDPNVISSDVPTLAVYYKERYIIHRQAVQVEHSRKAWEQSYRYVLHYLGERTLDDCCRSDVVEDFIESMQRIGTIRFVRETGKVSKVVGKKLSNATVNDSLGALEAILNLAYHEGLLVIPPKVEKLKTVKKIPTVPTVEDIRKLLTTSQALVEKAPYLVEVIFLVIDTGLRRRELFGLRWKDVDLKSETIRVHREGRDRLAEGKVYLQHHSKSRIIPMTRRVKKIVERLQAVVPNGDDDFIVPNVNGIPYTPVDNSYRKGSRGFDVAVNKAGLTGCVTFSGLRDLFAYRLLRKNVPLSYVTELMGYENDRTASDRYGHWVSDDSSSTAEFARQWFEDGKDE